MKRIEVGNTKRFKNYVFKLIGKLLKKVYVKFDLVIFKTINDTEKRVDLFDNLGKQLNYEE